MMNRGLTQRIQLNIAGWFGGAKVGGVAVSRVEELQGVCPCYLGLLPLRLGRCGQAWQTLT